VESLDPTERPPLFIERYADGGLEVKLLTSSQDATDQTGPHLIRRVVIDAEDNVILIEREWHQNVRTGLWERFPWGEGQGKSRFEGPAFNAWADEWAEQQMRDCYFTILDVVRHLGITRQAVQKHINAGHLPAVQDVACRHQLQLWLIHPVDLAAFRPELEKRRAKYRPQAVRPTRVNGSSLP
jgi:hypothetical protein